MEDKVTNEHPEYAKLAPLRKIFTDVCAGTKRLRDEGKAYLPQFPAEHDGDWTYRKDTATLLNVTEKTLQTLCGLVFQKDITLGDDVPKEIVKLAENIDNKGNHLNVFARDLFQDSFDGCAAILVDAPASGATDLADQQAKGLRPYWCKYKAADIINWNYEVDPVSRKTMLTLVVLRECETSITGQFTRTEKEQYLVLRMDGGPKWERWVEAGEKGVDGKKEFTKGETGSFGKQTVLPIAIVGDLCDQPPLMDLTYINVKLYQKESDYDSLAHKTCVPQLWTVGMEGEAPSAISGSTLWKLSEGGSMGFAEVRGDALATLKIANDDLKSDMALLGLAMLAGKPAKGDATATEKLLDSIQETSTLQVRATQLKDALELALGFTAQYLGLAEGKGGTLELGATWAEMVISAQELTALSNLVDLGQMSKLSLLWILEKTGKLRPDIDAQEELDTINQEMKDEAATLPVVNAVKMPNEKLVV